MKKLIVLVLITLSASAMAHGHGGHHRGHWARGNGGGWQWMVPTIVGGAIVPPFAASLFKINTNVALAVPMFCFAYIVYYAYSGYKVAEHE